MQLQAEGISKRFGNIIALDNVSFDIDQGEFISVIGPSGAGKTTLFRLLGGSEEPDSGSIRIGGEVFTGLSGKKKKQVQKKIGMIYQDFALVENVSCIQNVLNAALPDMHFFPAVAGMFSASQKQQAKEFLERVGIADKCDMPVCSLSGGQKQRVAIARALMRHPAILLADEPAASLDPVTGRAILDLLKDLQEQDGVTILMNSHNLTFSMDYSQRLFGLKDGKLVYDGPVDDIAADMLETIYGGAVEERSSESR